MIKPKKIFNVFFREKPALMLIHLLQKNGELMLGDILMMLIVIMVL